MKVSAIILAGGKSSRMGKDKGLIKYRGKPMVQHVIDVCRTFTSDIVISTNNQIYSVFGYPLVHDNFTEKGPIGGLEAALSISSTIDNIVCACDMPSLSPEIFELIMQKREGNFAVVVADDTGKVFPIPGWYRKSALPVIRQQINKGDYKMRSLLKKLDAETVVVSSEELLTNINYPSDLV